MTTSPRYTTTGESARVITINSSLHIAKYSSACVSSISLAHCLGSEKELNWTLKLNANGASRYLYNLSQPWITHYSIQHVHNKPADLWRIFGRKPFVWDEVKYEGDLPKNWGEMRLQYMVVNVMTPKAQDTNELVATFPLFFRLAHAISDGR